MIKIEPKFYSMSTLFSSKYYPDTVATVDDGKFTVSRIPPKNFDGEVIDLSESDMTIEQFVVLVDQYRAETPTRRLLILPEPPIKWLHENHPAFKPKQIEEL